MHVHGLIAPLILSFLPDSLQMITLQSPNEHSLISISDETGYEFWSLTNKIYLLIQQGISDSRWIFKLWKALMLSIRRQNWGKGKRIQIKGTRDWMKTIIMLSDSSFFPAENSEFQQPLIHWLWVEFIYIPYTDNEGMIIPISILIVYNFWWVLIAFPRQHPRISTKTI